MANLEAATVRAWPPIDDRVPAHWMSGTATAADGTTLHWVDTGGDGLPLVLLHGVQVDWRSWLRTALAVADDHRVVMPDLRGHGGSGRVGAAGTSARAMADDVALLLAALDVDRPVVVGHSMGAEVAGLLASAWPAAGVLLLEPALVDLGAASAFDLDDPPPWMAGLFATLQRLPGLGHADRMEAGLGLLPPGPPVPWDPVDYVAFVDGQARFDLDVYRDPGAFRALTPEVVAAIDCPILLITARQMPHVDLDRGVRAFADHWHHGEHVHLPDSGHAVQAEQLERFVELLTGFVARCRAHDGREPT
jgi:pimeloyl-ACP methyl ester carboxylesterase